MNLDMNYTEPTYSQLVVAGYLLKKEKKNMYTSSDKNSSIQYFNNLELTVSEIRVFISVIACGKSTGAN